MKYLSTFLWIAILTLTGTYIRTREGSSIEALTIDWLIIAQIGTCALGGLMGFFSMLRQDRWGFGVKSLAIFIIIAAFFAVFNPYPAKVIGYWTLLSGASLLTMGLVYSAQTAEALRRIENVWLFTMVVLIFKDSFTGFLLILGQGGGYSGLNRLGMGITHANFLSFNAAVAFWLTFKKNDEIRASFLLWIMRGILIIPILMSRSRMSLLCFLLGGVIAIWFLLGRKPLLAAWHMRLAILSLGVSLVIGFSLALLAEVPLFGTIFETVNRGQSAEQILSVTGRIEIWAIAIDKIFENFVSFFCGHGYGMSRFVLNEGTVSIDWYAYHAHNTFLEVLLSMGFVGFCVFLSLIFYSLKWIVNFNELQAIFSFGFALRAVIVIAMLAVYSITEAVFMKIGPMFLIFIFYLLALDRRDALLGGDRKGDNWSSVLGK